MKAFWARSIPNLLVFVSSMCMMIVELVAGRLIARNVGQSLYTWTSVIGVILGGMCFGNWLGGKLADRFAPRKSIPWLFMAASLFCLATIYLNARSGRWISPSKDADALLVVRSLPLRVLLGVSLTFFLPGAALGAISPVVAKMAVELARHTGAALGNVYAWGALGSILGTFLTGFYLIGVLGTTAIIMIVAAVLALIGVILGTTLHDVWAGVALGMCVLTFAPAPRLAALGRHWKVREVRGLWDEKTIPLQERYERSDERDAKGFWNVFTVYTTESDYNFIKVSESRPPTAAQAPMRTLVLDSLQHGYVTRGHPETLDYQYENIYSTLTRRAAGSTKPLKVFFIGGGSYTFPRYLERKYPGSTIEVAEIDPAVERTAHEALWLPSNTPIHTRIDDARNTIDDDLRAGRQYDFIYGDAFNHFSVPWHLTTEEFDEKIKALLAPAGVYMINVIDLFPLPNAPRDLGRFLGAYLNTAERCFGKGNVYVFATSRKPPSRADHPRRETFIVACARQPLDLERLGLRAGEIALDGIRLSEAELATLRARAARLVLTDDFAPVDNLLAPVVRDRSSEED